MSQQTFIRTIDSVTSVHAAPKCVLLRNDKHVAPPEPGGLALCVIVGSCIAQRLVGGQWIDQATFFQSGALMVAGGAPIRIVGQPSVEAVVLLLTEDAVTTHFFHIARTMATAPVLKIPADPMVTSLAKVLMASEFEATGARFQENVTEVMLARLAQCTQGRLLVDQPRAGTLPSWRFRRVATWVSERIGEEVSLAGMAAVAGLSPMHFAAQFKATVGVTPHQYVLLQRIEEAKAKLRSSQASILDIALSVGFQTQAHFATVFKRMEQTTPSQWRRTQLAA